MSWTMRSGDAVQNPVDTVKQRLQMSGSPYRGVWDCVARTVRTEGVGALYRSYPTTLAMNVPFTAIHFTAYESSKVFLQELKGDGAEVEDETFFVQFTAGGVAGGLAAAVTTPLDVVKTRMQTHCELAECGVATTVKPEAQPGSGKGVCALTGDSISCKGVGGVGGVGAGAGAGAGGGVGGATGQSGVAAVAKEAVGVAGSGSSHPYSSSSMTAVMRSIVREEGAWALMRGWGPRVLFHIPAGAISWATYEAGKRLLGVSGSGGHHH